MAAVRDKNVRGKNGDRSVDTVDTIYWNTDLCKPVSGSQGRDSTLHHSKEDNILRISIWIAISFVDIWQIMISSSFFC